MTSEFGSEGNRVGLHCNTSLDENVDRKKGQTRDEVRQEANDRGQRKVTSSQNFYAHVSQIKLIM